MIVNFEKVNPLSPV